MKLRQAQELVRLVAKNEGDSLKDDWNDWRFSEGIFKGKPNIFRMLLTIFNEVRGDLELSRIEEDFKYDSRYIGLSLSKKVKSNSEQFEFSKEVQAENIKELLSQIPHTEMLVFTDGSALTNPGPTGGSAIVYLDGPTSDRVCLKKNHCSFSNNYTGELVGLQLGLNFLNSRQATEHSTLFHRLSTCNYSCFYEFCPREQCRTGVRDKRSTMGGPKKRTRSSSTLMSGSYEYLWS